MNVERFHAIINALESELEETQEASLLEQLASATRELASNPAQESAQQQVSKTRADLAQALEGADSNRFSPAWREALGELGVTDLLGETLANQIEATFSANEITPATAAYEIDAIKQRVEALAQGLSQASAALSFFEFGAEELSPGEFEIGFLIPRDVVHNGLGSLGEEFVNLKKVLGPFTELAGESRPDIGIRSLSSSEFQVFLDSAPGLAVTLATALERLIATYERILHIKEKRRELAEEDVPEEVLEPISEHASGIMATEIEQIVDETVKAAKLRDQGRINELRTELTRSLNGLATRIDKGYNVEIRTGKLPPASEEGEDEDDIGPETRSAAENIQSKQESLEFMNVSGPPILSLREPEDP